MDILTQSEIDTIIEALEVWKNRHQSGELMTSIMNRMLSRDEEQFERVREKMEEIQAGEKEKESRQRDMAMLLQAKLVRMKQDLRKDQNNPFSQKTRNG